MDMSKFIVAKSDQLNSDDLTGGPITVTITSVRGAEGDQPVAVHYDGDGGKPFKPCKSMRRVMVSCWGKNAAEYAGRSMTLYRDPEVAFGGMKVGGIRISHMSHIDAPKQMALTATRGKKAPYKVLPLKDAPQQQEPTRQAATADPAVTWSSNFVLRLSNVDDADVEAFVAERSVKLAELKQKRPDLYDEVNAAIQARRTLAEDDVAFDAPQTTEGYDGV